jgi:hypothetical protein
LADARKSLEKPADAGQNDELAFRCSAAGALPVMADFCGFPSEWPLNRHALI